MRVALLVGLAALVAAGVPFEDPPRQQAKAAYRLTAAGTPPTVGGCQVFPPFAGPETARSAADQTAWNQEVTKAPVRRNSREIIRRINADGGDFLHPDFGSDPDYGIPFVAVPEDQAEVPVKIGPNGYPDESDFGAGTDGPPSAPIPATAPIEAGSDRHVLVVRRGGCRLYEMYRAVYLGGTGQRWQADATAAFDLPAAVPLRNGGEYATSADAAGLPILPGLVRYAEVAAGEVRHAIRVTFEATRRAYHHPATHYASSSCKATRPAMGTRLRLKGGYYSEHVDEFPPGSQSRAIFTALRRYGMLVADNGRNWYITGQTHPNWNDGDLNRLKAIPGRAFQVVKSRAPAITPC